MLAPQTKPKTLKDVSEAAGLSLITVSRALRQPEMVQEATRERVLRAIDAVGYVPNLTARSLVSSRSNMIGLVVPILSSSLFADLAQGVASHLQRQNLQMLLGVSQRDVDLEAEAVRTFIGRQADAIIVTGFTHSPACHSLLRAFTGPVVETWNLRNDMIDSVVGYDNVAAAAAMTRYLIAKEYQEIVVVGGDFENNDQAADRLAGFVATMREAGRSVRPENISAVATPTTMQSGRAAMLELMRRKRPPDAVFFQAEIPAHGAMLACISAGISIPDQVAIAGFGDLSLSPLLPVPLTTIKIRSHEIGEAAAQMVVQRLAGGGTKRSIVDVGFELVVRESA
jgi:LacI family gluconate utilization system Gnt-I transcriptional repressor